MSARTERAADAVIAAGTCLGLTVEATREGHTPVVVARGEWRPGEPVRRGMPTYWFSATKPLVALGVLLLWQDGALSLDDPVARVLPRFGAAGKSGITLRELLTHTAPMRDLLEPLPYTASFSEIVDAVCLLPAEPTYATGRYIGLASWYALAAVVEQITDTPFAEWIRDRVLAPAGASSTYVGVPSEMLAYQVEAGARPWFLADSSLSALGRLDPERLIGDVNPAGGGWGPASDMVALYQSLLAGPQNSLGLRPAVLEAAVANHRSGISDDVYGPRAEFGLGFMRNLHRFGIGTAPSRRSFGHTGAEAVVVVADPVGEVVVVVAVHGIGGSSRAVLGRMVDAAYHDLGLSDPVGRIKALAR